MNGFSSDLLSSIHKEASQVMGTHEGQTADISLESQEEGVNPNPKHAWLCSWQCRSYIAHLLGIWKASGDI